MGASSSDAVEQPKEDSTVAGGSRKGYYLVVGLVTTSTTALPTVLYFVLVSGLASFLFSQDIAGILQPSVIVQYLTFLITPGLFFVILYFYGSKTKGYFVESYRIVIVILLLGSIIGDLIYVSSIFIVQRQAPILDTQFWLSFSLGAVTGGVRNIFVGFSALGLAYLRTRNPQPSPNSPLP